MDQTSLVGYTLANRFEVRALIGEGAMGDVYLAENRNLGQKFAIKVLKQAVQADQRIAERFRREAWAASKLDHPNIVSITDFGATDDGRLYIVMDYAPGKSLQEVMDEAQPDLLNLPRVLRILSQIAGALGVAHDHGIVHRDLKPANIFVTYTEYGEERVMILDFGLAKIMNVPELSVLTREGEIFGTPIYMSPEQAAGEPVDSRADIYSFGVLAYELLSGRAPFMGENLIQIIIAHQEATPLHVTEARPAEATAIPDTLAKTVMASLEKRPDDRPLRISEVKRVIDACHEKLRDQGKIRRSTILPPSQERIRSQFWDEEPTSAELKHAETQPTASLDAIQAKLDPNLSQTHREWVWSQVCKKARELATRLSKADPGTADIQARLGTIEQTEERVLSEEMDIALLREEIEQLETQYREQESRLRYAVIELSIQRGQLSDDPDAPAGAIEDLDFQIQSLEQRIADAYREFMEPRKEVEQRLNVLTDTISASHQELIDYDLELLRLIQHYQSTRELPGKMGSAYQSLSKLLHEL